MAGGSARMAKEMAFRLPACLFLRGKEAGMT